jgi:hypothetical protein
MLNKMIDASIAIDESKVDFHNVFPASVQFLENRTVVVDSVPLRPTQWSMAQLYSKIGYKDYKHHAFPAPFMDAQPGFLWASIMKYWVSGCEDRNWLIRSFGKDQLRAVLSNQYAIVDNTWCLQTAQEALDGIQFEITNHVLMQDACRLSIAVKTVEATEPNRKNMYKIGFDTGTGEIGNRRLYVRPFVQRTSCVNSILFDEVFIVSHRGNEQYLKSRYIEAVCQAIASSDSCLDRMLKSVNYPIRDIHKTIEKMSKEHHWSSTVTNDVLVGMEGSVTLFGLVNGISYAAGLVDNVDEQYEMQCISGGLLRV